MTTPGRVERWAGRAGLTEGQLYTSVITLAVAALLATGLGNVHGVVSSALVQSPLAALPSAPSAVLPPIVVPTPAALPPPLPPPPYETAAGGPLAAPQGPPPGSDPQPAPLPATSPSPEPSPTPSASPCAAQPVDDAGAELVRAINAAAGGGLPEKDLLAAIGLITGCGPDDPAVVAIGLLIGIGQTLPDPGVPNPPVIPVVQIPAPVVAALQPLRPAIDEVCGVVGTGQVVAALFITAYPQPVPVATAQVLFQALSVCGQLRAP